MYYRIENKQVAVDRDRPGAKIAEGFELNKLQLSARTQFYSEYVMYFIWNQSAKR